MGQMFQLLEGDTINFAAPKNVYGQNITLTSDATIFATMCSKITYIQKNDVNEMQTKMMETNGRHLTSSAAWRRMRLFSTKRVTNVMQHLYIRF